MDSPEFIVSEYSKIISIIVISVYILSSIVHYLIVPKQNRKRILEDNLYLYLFGIHRLIFYIVSSGDWFRLTRVNYTLVMNTWSMAINMQLFFYLVYNTCIRINNARK